MTALRGVNIGGWFIPEKWMQPEMFAGLDAIDFHTLIATDEGKQRYHDHVNAFMSEKDFSDLKEVGCTILRIPVAWWMVEDEFSYCLEKLDWAMDMAEQYGIHVLLDYHGAIGSQNGKDHSGKKGDAGWNRHITENVQVLKTIAERYAGSSALWGIELLNEPAVRRNYFTLLQFYRKADRALRRMLPDHVLIIFHDGFHPLLFLGALGFSSRIVMDMHLYEIACCRDDSLESYMNRRDLRYRRKIAFYGKFQQLMIGEWSGVLPQQLLKNLSQAEKQQVVAENVERQVALYSEVKAWTFWSYKTNDTMMWNFDELVGKSDLLL